MQARKKAMSPDKLNERSTSADVTGRLIKNLAYSDKIPVSSHAFSNLNPQNVLCMEPTALKHEILMFNRQPQMAVFGEIMVNI